MPGELKLDRPADAVARLTISNPDKRNALDHAILDALAEALPPLDEGIETRCVLITGEGSIFSAGYDIGGISDSGFSEEAEALVAHPFHAAMEAISAHPLPVVAAINGPRPGRRARARGPLRPADLRRGRRSWACHRPSSG